MSSLSEFWERATDRWMSVRRALRLPRISTLWDSFDHSGPLSDSDWLIRLRRKWSDDDQELKLLGLINPFSWLAWTMQFIVRWFATRDVKSILPAVPAIAVASTLTALALIAILRDDSQSETTYGDVLTNAIRESETRRAEIAAERLLVLAPENPGYRFQLALLYQLQGHPTDAMAIMNQLAMSDQYSPAALWVLDSMMFVNASDGIAPRGGTMVREGMTRRTQWSDSQREMIDRLYQITKGRLPEKESRYASELYAHFLMDTGATKPAAEMFDELARQDRSQSLQAAQLMAELGDQQNANRLAKEAVTHLQATIRETPADVESRLGLARAFAIRGEHHLAYKTLSEGMRVAEDERLRWPCAEALLTMSEKLGASVDNSESFLQRANIVAQAALVAPDHVDVRQALLQLAHDSPSVDLSNTAAAHLAMLRDNSNQRAHLIEAIVFLLAGDESKARPHLDLAFRRESEADAIHLVSVLAGLLGVGDPGNQKQGLKLLNQTLQRCPDDWRLLLARGKLLHRMGEAQAARADLERVLACSDSERTCHELLAEIFREIGDDSSAAKHSQLANEADRTVNVRSGELTSPVNVSEN
ncbi:tetratricopeptide repeat protein [Stieleria varia]|uniref:Anaphase-promoting complex, cyclosome, subunit 3 n=1 Tax=Stieleria varia TaxID=2528005 RepID=A0A5C6B3T1_9BACT|nr:hypothetical protein [Stieleria varia]TWU05936.1 Anaphase-promoting complex, cyclosome, subunit 3 [Stieleria varia]